MHIRVLSDEGIFITRVARKPVFGSVWSGVASMEDWWDSMLTMLDMLDCSSETEVVPHLIELSEWSWWGAGAAPWSEQGLCLFAKAEKGWTYWSAQLFYILRLHYKIQIGYSQLVELIVCLSPSLPIQKWLSYQNIFNLKSGSKWAHTLFACLYHTTKSFPICIICSHKSQIRPH